MDTMTLLIAIALLLILSILFVLFIFLFGSNKDSEKVEVLEEVRNPLVMQILVPRENDRTPLAAEQMFASIHGILGDSPKSLDLISFEIVSSDIGGIRFYTVVPQHLAKFVEGQIYAQYPNADITYVADYTKNTETNTKLFVTSGEVELEKDFIFPIKTFRSFEVDPLAAITGAISDLKFGQSAWVQIIVRPVSNYWQSNSKKYITAIRDGKDPYGGGFLDQLVSIVRAVGDNIASMGSEKEAARKETVRLQPGQEEELSEIENKMLKLGFEFGIRVITKAPTQIESEQILRDIVASFKQFTTAHLNSFVHSNPLKTGEDMFKDYVTRYLPSDTVDILNIEELASVYHMPNISVETPNIAWSRSKKIEPPMNLPQTGADGVTIFAETDYRGTRVEFGLKREDRRKHFYLLGKTGVGKSTVFKNMIISDILRGDGACLVDPHGDTVEELLDYIPQERIKDVIYFNPTDTQYPVGFNLLELKDKSQRDLIADGVVEVFRKQFGDSWGPRLQYILTNTVATALEAQGTTLLSILRLLMDKNYRKFILKQVNDPILYKFWTEEFAQMSLNQKLLSESISPIQNKVGRFVSSAVTRNIIGQVKSTIDLRDIMDNKKILLVNLAQGKLGEETASLLGGMIITRLQSTALERVDIPFDERNDFFLFVDEFQNFATDSFAKILSEARKFKLDLTMTNQYIDQLPLTVRQAIFGNVGTLGSFVVSQSDASVLERELAPNVTSEDLVSLDAHSMYLKLCIDGMTSVPFSARSLPPRFEPFGLREEVIKYSRETYGTPREVIEDKIIRWSNQSYSENGNRSVKKTEQKEKVEVKRKSDVKEEIATIEITDTEESSKYKVKLDE